MSPYVLFVYGDEDDVGVSPHETDFTFAKCGCLPNNFFLPVGRTKDALCGGWLMCSTILGGDFLQYGRRFSRVITGTGFWLYGCAGHPPVLRHRFEATRQAGINADFPT